MTGTTLRIKGLGNAATANREIGRLLFGGAGHLDLVDADPAHASTLNWIIKDTNARTALRLEAPPPPGAAQFSLYAVDVDRSSPDLLAYMIRFLDEYHGVTVEILDENGKN
ncbi:hypothetical protein [Roseibium sp. RKSG952]|uniref:hypothetical protein n=1 Tax=Roseibium sp. RKSG952 TaxID=2529384 RepID=UPI0012BBCAC5|nr:hypothetical protein [Roseibium sp. RKSG952]MTI00420.1 hypothetical protein [Roseibium sp. RKSG952]